MSTIFGTIINVNMVENYLAGLNLSGSWKNSFLETLVEIYKESQKFGINPVIPKFERYKRNSKKADIFSENEISTLLSKNNYRDEMFYLMTKISLSCGLRKGELQGLRYTFITKMRRIVPAETVQKLAGHNFLEMTEYYTRMNIADSIRSDEMVDLRCKMLILDSMILNTDRHLNNFGFLRDPETLEWKGCAPIFDSGTSMLHHVSVPVLKINFENEIKQLKSKPFYKTFNEQLQRLPCQKYYDKLEINNLSGIDVYLKNLLSKNINISQERAELLCNILKNQIRDVRICLKSNAIKQTKNRNHDNWER